nr:hypothetical protein [Tanacetum cinerariifolium]
MAMRAREEKAKHDALGGEVDYGWNNSKDIRFVKDVGFESSAADDQPIAEASQHPEWFSQQKKPPTPDRDWNKTLLVTHESIQPWISELAKQTDSRLSFNKLVDTPVDFLAFLMNQLKVDTLTLELLAGPTYELMKFYGFADNRESAHDVYSKLRIIAATEIKIVEWHNYKHLDWITPAIDEKHNPKVKLAVVKEKPVVVKEKLAVVKEKPAVVKEKLTVVKEKSAGVMSKFSKGNDDVVKALVVVDKVIDKSDSPRRRWLSLSEMMSNKPGDIVVNIQPISQYNPVTSQVVKESDKVQQPKVKPAIDEKHNPKVSVIADKVSVITDKALVVKATVADKAPVVKATVADNVIADKEPVKEKSAGNMGKATVKDKVKVSFLEGSLASVKENIKASVKDNVEVSVLKGNFLVDVVPDDMVLNKAMGKASINDKFKLPVKDKV